MKLTGGCYCRAVRYEVEGEPIMRSQCHCRECQYISGGGPNYAMVMPKADFRYTQGAPKRFQRADLPDGVVREFCAECGTHLGGGPPQRPDIMVLKVGTLDDPAAFEGPQVVIWTRDAQPFHLTPDGVPAFEGFPGR